MSDTRLYVEGGGSSKELKTRCREAFHKLLEKSGFQGRVPRIVACGSRNDAYDAFVTTHAQGALDYVALLVDSEDPVKDMEKVWEHLQARDSWQRPAAAAEDQVFLMTTCMETWIAADRASLKLHYRSCLQESALPSTVDLEKRRRNDIHAALEHATRTCSNAYAKNKRSFEALADVNPYELTKHCPSFVRMVRILNEKL